MENLHALEINIILFLQSLWSGLPVLGRVLTFLGDEMFFILFMPVIYWCVDAFAGLRIGMLLLLGTSLNAMSKMLFRQPRPYWISSQVRPLVRETSFGIPSGHTMNSAAVWGGVAVEARQRWVSAACGVLVLLVGFSRLVLGAHFLSDVLAGILFGGLLVLVFTVARNAVSGWFWSLRLRGQILVSLASSLTMIGLSGLARLGASAWSMPAEWAALAGEVEPFSMKGSLTAAGLWFGMLGGFALLRNRKGVLQSADGQWQKIARYLLGTVGLLALYAGLGRLFGLVTVSSGGAWAAAVLRYLRYGLMGAWVSLFAPLLFESLRIARIKPLDQVSA